MITSSESGKYVKVATSNDGTSHTGLSGAISGFVAATDDAARAIAKFAVETRGFVDAYKPYDISDVKLILPHKKHLVPMHQEAKNREQLIMWGLRKR